MKKIFLTLAVSILLISLPIMTATSSPLTKNYRPSFLLEKTGLKSDSDDPPSWADGTFKGTWGIREYILFIGVVNVTLGNVSGYYAKNRLGWIAGTFYVKNETGKDTPVSEFKGIFFNVFFCGRLGEMDVKVDENYNTSNNETPFVGIGYQNETKFDWRVMGLKGPTFFMKGEFE